MTHRRKMLLQPDCDDNISDLSDLIVACASMSFKDKSCLPSSLDALVETLAGQLVEKFELFDDSSIICQIIDLISMLAIHVDINKACAVLKNVTRNALGTIYNSTNAKVDLPYMLCKIQHCLRGDAQSQASFSRLFQLAKKIMKSKDLAAFIHHLLSHWSVLILSGSYQDHFLADICESVDDVLSFASGIKSRRTDKRVSKSKQFPGLNAKMCTNIFELLMQMTASSLSLVRPFRTYKKRNNRDESERTSHDDTIHLLAVFHKMLRTFRSHSIFFSRCAFFGVTKTSFLVAKLSIHHLQNCVRWRSSQQFSLHKLANDNQAGVNSLQPLVDAICSHCIGSIMIFCDSFRRSDSKTGHCYKYSKAIATLSYKCEGLKKDVQSICRTQGFVQNNVTQNESNLDDPNSSKRSNESDHQVKKRPRNIESSYNLGTAHTASGAWSESSSAEGDDSDVTSNDDSSFGALGDWG